MRVHATTEQEAATKLRWFRSPVTPDGLDFSQASLNTCFNAADRHVATGRADELALAGRSVLTDEPIALTFADLTERAAKLAGIFRALEVAAGDTVVISLPDCVERVIGMLAVARIGANFLIAGDSGRQSGAVASYATAVLSNEPVQHDRCVRIGDAVDGEFDYRALMRSTAVSSAECVDVPAAAALRLAIVTPGGPLEAVCDNGSHAVALAQVALDEAADSRELAGAGRAIDHRAIDHPCRVIAPLLLGQPAILPD